MLKLGFFDKDKNLNLNIWEKKTENEIKVLKLHYEGNIYTLETIYNDGKEYCIMIKYKNKKILLKREVKSDIMPDYTFLIRDLDNDNNDEIIECHHWYIVNGDNYDFTIYKLQIK